jgi:CHAP domain
MRRFSPLLSVLLLLSLAACGGGASRDLGQRAPLECAPFARALSGVQLRGNASEWWWKASGRYARGHVPETGAVMVFARTPRLPQGHVAVVSEVRSQREILVTQANWVHHHVTTDQLVLDDSPRGDWSVVRVWWPPSGTLGTTEYPVQGFIYPGYPMTHDAVARAVPSAVTTALNN